jgi:hypothetical protein
VFKVKKNSDGSVEHYKARVVAKGFSQRPGIDFFDTFAPTTKWALLCAILAVAALQDLKLESFDISTAYLNEEIDAEVYMRQPEGFEQRGPDWVCKLLKGLYGLKQGGKLWFDKLDGVLTELGFKRICSDASIYVWDKDGLKLIVPIFVDDLTIASKSKQQISQFKSDLAKHFRLWDLGPMLFLLGVSIQQNRSKHQLRLSQCQYAIDLLQQFEFADCGPVSTPMDPGLCLSVSQAPSTPEEVQAMKNVPYINAVGAWMYLAIATCQDIVERGDFSPLRWSWLWLTVPNFAFSISCKVHCGPLLMSWSCDLMYLKVWCAGTLLKRSFPSYHLHTGPGMFS